MKYLLYLVILVILLETSVFLLYSSNLKEKIVILENLVEEYEDLGYGVKGNGFLQVENAALTNQHGEPVQLRGMSTHGLMWFSEYTNARAAQTIYEYGGNVMRIALYSDQNEGYIYKPKETQKALFMAIENCLAADMYVIVDWHILMDNNPNTNADYAAELFDIVTSYYGDNPAILYEICNEPNGNVVWDDVRNYANKIIPIIRKNAPSSVILVGTPKHSTDLSGPMENPLNYNNIMYTYHQYTDTMDEGYKWILNKAIENKLPLFVSEWGVSEKTGDGQINIEKAQEFINFLNANGISWTNWSLSNKNESSAALKSSSDKLSKWSVNDLSLSGQMVFENFKREKE